MSKSKCCNAEIGFDTGHGDIAYCDKCKKVVDDREPKDGGKNV